MSQLLPTRAGNGPSQKLTIWLTDSCYCDLIDVTLAEEDASWQFVFVIVDLNSNAADSLTTVCFQLCDCLKTSWWQLLDIRLVHYNTGGRNMDWEKKMYHRGFVLIWHTIMCRLRIQKIKIRWWGGFEKIEFFSLFLMRIEKTTLQWSKVVSEAIFPTLN